MSIRALLIGVAVAFGSWQQARGADWMFDYGPYTGNAQAGVRVEQFRRPKVPRVDSYDKFFNKDHPYIPYGFYWNELGLPGSLNSMPYGIYSSPYGGISDAGFGSGFVGPYAW